MTENRPQDRFIDEATWRHFWHPVCTLEELRAADPSGKGPLKVTLLEEALAIAELEEGVVALSDRCCHRSASLSVGYVDNGKMRCRYHGWAYDGSGKCVEIPACPELEIPPQAKVGKFDTQVAYDLVWVRLDSSVDTKLPVCPAFDNPELRTLQGKPYDWKTSAARRLENYVDLSHFAFVHPNSLFDPNIQDVTPPRIDRIGGDLVFKFECPEDLPIPDLAPQGNNYYNITMPFGVNVRFDMPEGKKTNLWMFPSPIDSKNCRSFWFHSRNFDLEPRDGLDIEALDKVHLDFQERILNEDIEVIESQNPAEIPAGGSELAVYTDKVSIQYRRWLRQLEKAAKEGADALLSCIEAEVLDPTEKSD